MTFEYEGKRVSAFEGDTVASALYSAGERIFSRSFKYHRPRGLLCVSGQCPNCLMEIDGVPNVRACRTAAREGLKVRHQNAWPSLDHDFYAVIDKVMDRFMPVGFYYKTFIHGPLSWRRVEGPIRGIAGIGSIEQELRRTGSQSSNSDDKNARKSQSEHGDGFEQLFLTTEVAVVGGGLSGMTCAIEAAKLGAKVTLVDDQESLGGCLRFSDDVVEIEQCDLEENDVESMRTIDAAELLHKTRIEIEALRDKIRVLTNATAFGYYESNLLGILQNNTRMIRLRAKEIIVAAGSHEYPMVFQNNDLPGVFLARGLQRLVRLFGVRPDGNIVVVTNNDSGLSVAKTLLEADIPIAAYVDARGRNGATTEDPEARWRDSIIKRMEASGVPILNNCTIKEAVGSKRVESARLVRLDDAGTPIEGTERDVPCSIICLSNGFEAEASLLAQAGCKSAYDTGLEEFVSSDFGPTTFACGEVTGIHDARTNVIQAKVAARSAYLRMQHENASAVLQPSQRADEANIVAASDSLSRNLSQSLGRYSDKLRKYESAYRNRIILNKSKSIAALRDYWDISEMKKRFVCVCEDVAEKDLCQAVFEGFDNVETLKRYSTVSMGPCQGKMCSTPLVSVCARETGRTMSEAGRTISRPPCQPVPMGALAGVKQHPVKLTPMHYKHVELGAKLMDMGEWKRPHTYSSVLEEYKAVRERVGIIDVGTLGRLDVRGKDAPKLLDFVYTHVFSKLQIGKSRYGVICDEAGTILDDGTVTRLSEYHYFITTTTGNIDFVEQWFIWWATALQLDVQVTNVTAGLAAVNVAGPNARSLLQKLTEIDLSTESFQYLAAKEGLVAGVPCILLRIGFVGETSWEIHFPAEYGEYFWDALMTAGKEFEVRPFGVEAQRLLRLEKKHVIVGQDTDAITNPIEADLSWAVKFEKSDFVGKAMLQRIHKAGVKRKLVGFQTIDSAVVREGDQVYLDSSYQMEGGAAGRGRVPVGYVTSSRISPLLGKNVGLMWVPTQSAKEGSAVRISAEGKLTEATVTFPAFYDPEGKKLRS